MAIAILGNSGTQVNGSGDVSLLKPNDGAGGSLLSTDHMLAILWATPTSVPSGWQLVNSSNSLFMYEAFVSEAGAGPYVWGNSSSSHVAALGSYRGVDLLNPIDAQGADYTSSASDNIYPAPTVDPTVINTLIVGAFGGGGGGISGTTTWTVATGMTLQHERTMGGTAPKAILLATEPRAVDTGTGTRQSSTSNNAAQRGAFLVALRPAIELGEPHSAGILQAA